MKRMVMKAIESMSKRMRDRIRDELIIYRVQILSREML